MLRSIGLVTMLASAIAQDAVVLSPEELTDLATKNAKVLERCLSSSSKVSVDVCFEGLDLDILKFYAPVEGAPFEGQRFKDYLKGITAGFERTTTWISRFYTGYNQVTYVADVLHECGSDIVESNEIVVHLHVDPETKLVTQIQHSYSASKFQHILAKCAGNEAIPSIQTSYPAEEAIVAKMDKFWPLGLSADRTLDPADAQVLDDDLIFCVGGLSKSQCTTSKQAFLDLVGLYAPATGRETLLVHKTTCSPGHCWQSISEVIRCPSGRPFRHVGELFYDLDMETGKVIRITDLQDKAVLDNWCFALDEVQQAEL